MANGGLSGRDTVGEIDGLDVNEVDIIFERCRDGNFLWGFVSRSWEKGASEPLDSYETAE